MAVTLLLTGAQRDCSFPTTFRRGFVQDLTHPGIVCKETALAGAMAKPKPAQPHCWVKRTVSVPKSTEIWATSQQCHSLSCL